MTERALSASVLAEFFNKDGRLLIPAFTVHDVWDNDAKFTYWIVNLHDIAVDSGTQFNLKLFHDQESAEQFASEHRNKVQ